MSEYGMSLFTSATGINNTIGRTTTQQFPAPAYSDLAWTKASPDFGSDVTSAEGKLNFSDFLNVFLLNQKYDLGVLIKALQNKGLFQSLAEPNLVAESGKEASFLAGGEFPVPVAQGSGANIGVSVMFKEFGIRLNFTPTVVGDRVHLKVRPEVSTLDYGNAVLLSGFRIPSLSTRRAETELELRNGQTFAIAGLMSNQMQTTMQKIPGIGDIPILGYLFKSKAAKRDQTELVVMITPEILPNDSPGVTPDLPKYPETFMPPLSDLKKTVPAPAPAFTGGSRSLAANPAAAPVVDTRTEIERAQDKALAALDHQAPQPAAAAAAAAPVSASPVVAPQAAAPVKAAAPQAAVKAAAPVAAPAQPVAVQPVAAQAPAAQSTDPASVNWKQAEADVAEASKDQRQLEKAAREQAERDAKVADKVRKEEAKRAAAAQAKQNELDRQQAKKDAEAAKVQAKKDAEAAQLQAKRDAEAAKVQAKRDAEAAKVQAQRNAELAKLQAKQDAEAAKGQAAADAAAQRQTLDAKREAERDAERQRAIDAAAERLRAAEAEYQAELARRTQR
jgi:hypothetical protein